MYTYCFSSFCELIYSIYYFIIKISVVHLAISCYCCLLAQKFLCDVKS